MTLPAVRPFDEIPLLSGGGGPRAQVGSLRHDRMGFLRRLAEAGDIHRLQLLVRHIVVVTGPALVQEVLVEKAAFSDKSSFMRYLLYPLAGEGLFTSRGELWRRQRKLMAPLFRSAQLARFAGDMVECAQRDADTWCDGAVVDLARETTRITMSVAGKTLFGAETFSEADEIGAALTVALSWVGHRAASLLPVLQIGVRKRLERLGERLPGRAGAWTRDLADRLHGPVLLAGAEGRRLREAVALLDERVQRMIDERRARADDAAPDLLARLLHARDEDDGGHMSDKQVRDEVLTLFIAGHETTASALAWGIYLLVRHPEIYRRVQAEADALGRPPRLEDLPRLPLCLRVFKEALRLYPPVPLFSRETTAPLSLGGYHLPAGSIVFLSPYGTHHRADLWPDPERFDPERFTPAAEEARPRYAFLSFSAGPRVCIGNHFALMEGPLVLATLLQRADFALAGVETVEPDVQATLRPRGGMPMRIRLRQPVQTISY